MNESKDTRKLLTFALAFVSIVFGIKSLLAFFWQNGSIAGWIYLGITIVFGSITILTAAQTKRKT